MYKIFSIIYVDVYYTRCPAVKCANVYKVVEWIELNKKSHTVKIRNNNQDIKY